MDLWLSATEPPETAPKFEFGTSQKLSRGDHCDMFEKGTPDVVIILIFTSQCRSQVQLFVTKPELA